MFSKKYNFSSLQLDTEIEKIRKKLLLDKKVTKKNELELFRIENFWIISKTGIAIFSLENTIFTSQDEQNLFAGFISAIVSLSQHLSKSNLTEIKIDKLSLHIQTFEQFFVVSLISSNHELALKYLTKLINLHATQLIDYIQAVKKEPLFDLRREYHTIIQDPEIKREIILSMSIDYISQFIFNLIELDVFFKKLHLLIRHVPPEYRKDYIQNLLDYIDKIKSIKVNNEIHDQLSIVVDSIQYFIDYSDKKNEERYNKYIKSLFVLFVQFFNKLYLDI